MILNLFDFDGTLVDSDDALFRAYRYAFAEEWITLTRKDWDDYVGIHFNELAKHLGAADDVAQKVHRTKYEVYPAKFLDIITANECMEQYYKEDVPNHNIIVTHTNRFVVRRILKELKISRYFDDVVDLELGGGICKPSPFVYVTALQHAFTTAKRRNEKISEIRIFEDSSVGIAAAIHTKRFVKEHIDENLKCRVYHVDNCEIIRGVAS